MAADVVPFDFRVVEVVEIVDDCDVLDVGGEQPIYEMRSDEPGAASDKKVLHPRLTL